MKKHYILRRCLQIIPILIIVSFFSFFIINAAPGNAIDNYIRTDMTPQQIHELKVQYGVDGTWVEQFLGWWKRVLQGDFGMSIYKHRPVAELLKERLASTVILVGSSLLLSLIVSIPFGLIAGYNYNRKIDKCISFFTYLGISIPQFWLGMIVIIIFSMKLSWLPSGGIQTVGNTTTGDFIKHLILPMIVMSFSNTAIYIRYIRSRTISEWREDYVQMAISKGASELYVLFHHVLKNSLLPIITLLGMNLASIVTGSVVIETVFSWPGIGKLAMDAITSRDYPVIMGYTMFSGVFLIFGNFFADILYTFVDPRIRRSMDIKNER